jgi:hypothetical protein
MPPTRLVPVLLLAAALSAGLAARADEACRLHRVASAAARVTSANQLLVSATVNGIAVELIASSGVRFSTLTRRFADRAGLPVEDVRAPPYGARTLEVSQIINLTSKMKNGFGHSDGDFFERARVPELLLGNARSDDELFVVTPGGDGTDQAPVGVFGADYLSGYEVEIDPVGGRLNLFDHEHCPGRVVYWSNTWSVLPIHVDGDTRRITTPVELDGVPFDATIDTGASATTMPLAVAARRFAMGADSPLLTAEAPAVTLDGHTIQSWAGSFHTLTLGGVIVHSPRISVEAFRDAAEPPTGSHIPEAGEPELRIGMNVLKALHLVIAYGEDRLYYTPARSAPM